MATGIQWGFPRRCKKKGPLKAAPNTHGFSEPCSVTVLLRIRVVEVDPSKMPPPTIFGFDHSLIGDDTHPIMLGKR